MSILAGLPDDVSELLASPPLTEKKLLEIALNWEGLPPEQAAMADALRLFVVTWDPIEWRAPRPDAIATANARPVEIVVYTPLWSAASLADKNETTLAAVFTELANSAVVTAAENEGAVTFGGYATLAAGGKVPDLLSARGTEAASALGQPAIVAVSPEWEGIGLGAITDFVRHAYGNVNLDRSPVRLTAPGTNPTCPACRGLSFGFPADLNETAEFMCAAHQNEARSVTRSRLAQAENSNRAGWRMIGDASARLSKPHLPGGLATKLAATGLERTGRPEPDVLVARAQVVAEAAKWFPAQPDEFAEALRKGRGQHSGFPGWLTSLIRDLGRAGKTAEATMVSEALAVIDPGLRTVYESQAQLALAEAEFAKVSGQSQRSGSPAQTQRHQPRAKGSKAQRQGKRQ